MKNFARWFWAPILMLLVTAAVIWAGGVIITQDVPTNTAQWRARATANQKKRATRQHNIGDVDTTTLARAQAHATTLQWQYGMGELVMPSIETDLSIYSVVTNATLCTGVARYFPERPMGQGNNVYAAHHLVSTSILLNRTGQLKKGAAITQTDFKHVYHYRVIYNRVIKETETTVLNQTSESRITLIHCEGPLNTPYRRVVIGRLTKVTDYQARHAQRAARSTLLRRGQQLTGTLANPKLNRPLMFAALILFIILLGNAYRGFFNDRNSSR